MKHHARIPDKRPGFNCAAFEVDEVTHDAVISHGRRGMGRGVNHTTVLNRSARSDRDVAMITAQHRLWPDRAFRADRDVPDDRGIGMNESGGVDVGNEVAKGVNGHPVNVVRPTVAERTDFAVGWRKPRPTRTGTLG